MSLNKHQLESIKTIPHQKGHYIDPNTNKVKIRDKVYFKELKKNSCKVIIGLAKRNFNHEKREDIEIPEIQNHFKVESNEEAL